MAWHDVRRTFCLSALVVFAVACTTRPPAAIPADDEPGNSAKARTLPAPEAGVGPPPGPEDVVYQPANAPYFRLEVHAGAADLRSGDKTWQWPTRVPELAYFLYWESSAPKVHTFEGMPASVLIADKP